MDQERRSWNLLVAQTGQTSQTSRQDHEGGGEHPVDRRESVRRLEEVGTEMERDCLVLPLGEIRWKTGRMTARR